MFVFISFWTLTSIFCASSEGLKLDLMTTFTSSLVRPTSLTRGITRNGRMMSLVVRYLHYSAEQKQFMWKNVIVFYCSCNYFLICSFKQFSENKFQRSFKKKKSINWPHELIFSIRRDEADATLWVKLTEAHTLMESAVIDGDGLLPTAGRNTYSREKLILVHSSRIETLFFN